jgi:mannose-6-phosphate isomerase-like protein (cupin superfamily)
MSTTEHDVETTPYMSDPTDPSRHFVMKGAVMHGVDFVWHATGADTAGQVTIAQVHFPPGTEFLMHKHGREDEAFLVIEGELTIRDPDAEHDFVAGPGQMVWSPRNRKHTYANTGTVPAHVIVVMTPGTGLEGVFRDNIENTLPDLGEFAAYTEQSYGVTLFPDEPSAGTVRGY